MSKEVEKTRSTSLNLDSDLNDGLTSSSPPWTDSTEYSSLTSIQQQQNQQQPHVPNSTIKSHSKIRGYRHERESDLGTLTKLEFYQQENWIQELCEILFKISKRGTTIKAELYYGVIHFISCLYCLAVIPQQLINAGYGGRATVVSVALCTGAGSILCGLFANLPFVLAPPTVVSIFLSVYLQQKEQGPQLGSMAVVLSGILLMFFGWRPLATFTANLIPLPIQVGTAVGIGLLTSLAGSTEINLVEPGTYTILKIGKITPEICISFAGVIIVCIAMRFHWKGSFCIAVILCSLIWWIYDNNFPDSVAAFPSVDTVTFTSSNRSSTILLTVDLVFLYVLYLNGLTTSLSNLAVLTREDETIPRGRWVYIMCGIFTVIAGIMQSAPVLVSPESSASIKEGAKTGLSAVVAGFLFLIALFFSPLFENVPATGTSPVLIMIGVILFQNVSRIDWRNVTYAAPAFVVLFYIPFTYSIIQGVILGYVVYLAIAFSSGELAENTADLLSFYFPDSEQSIYRFFRVESRARATSAASGRRDSVGRGRRASETVSPGLVFADESGHLLPHEEQSRSRSTSSMGRGTADFGTDFRPVPTTDLDEAILA